MSFLVSFGVCDVLMGMAGAAAVVTIFYNAIGAYRDHRRCKSNREWF